MYTPNKAVSKMSNWEVMQRYETLLKELKDNNIEMGMKEMEINGLNKEIVNIKKDNKILRHENNRLETKDAQKIVDL